MKICFFKPNSLTTGGGAENWIIEVSRRLIKHHDIGVIGLKYTSEKRRLNFNKLISMLNHVNYCEYPFVKLPRGDAIPNPLYINHILDLFNTYDLTYVVVPTSPTEVLFHLFKTKIKSKLIAGFHGFLREDILLQRLYMPVFKKIINTFDAYHVLNRKTFFWLKKMGFDNIFYIPNGVNTKIFQLCETPSELRPFNILFTGRLTEDKGADILIKIINCVNEKFKNQSLQFTIAGSGPFKDIINEIAGKYENVQYLGFIPSRALISLYRSASIFLIPSRTEGMPLRLLESQSCGLPVVGSNIPGISDVIVDKKNGRLINISNINGFAEAIWEYYELWRSSAKEYGKLNREIRENIIHNYDWGNVICDLEKMFKECISI